MDYMGSRQCDMNIKWSHEVIWTLYQSRVICGQYIVSCRPFWTLQGTRETQGLYTCPGDQTDYRQCQEHVGTIYSPTRSNELQRDLVSIMSLSCPGRIGNVYVLLENYMYYKELKEGIRTLYGQEKLYWRYIVGERYINDVCSQDAACTIYSSSAIQTTYAPGGLC